MVVTAVIICATMRTKRIAITQNKNILIIKFPVIGQCPISKYNSAECNFMMSLPDAVISNVQPFNSPVAYIDTSPPLELLCIFRC